LYGSFEFRKIIFDHQPYSTDLDFVVFMSEEVPDGSQFGPPNGRAEFFCAHSQLLAASLIRSRHLSTAFGGFQILGERFHIHPGSELFD
jgi:hypothetical protein